MIRLGLILLVAGATLLPAALRHEPIYDPVLKMTAFNVSLPTNWKFDGTFVQGSSCSQTPFPVFRAYSPDGLSEVRRYPRLDWTWGNSPGQGPKHPDCLNLTQELSASEFLKYIMGVLQVAYLRDAPAPEQAIAAKQKLISQLNAQAANNSKILNLAPPVQHYDFAAAFAEYRNGSFPMEANIQAGVTCIRSSFGARVGQNWFAETCNANVRVVRAPKGQLAGLLSQVESEGIGAAENGQWVSRYMQAQQAKTNEIMQQMHRDFERAQAIRAQQHQQFLANLRAGTDRSMANARAIANANHTIASDWCDYALDQQTVTGSGGTVKISNAYTHTWSNGSGQYYQTNDPNANPNGVLPGSWSTQQRVHGDGTP
jgi:hypothetical protein